MEMAFLAASDRVATPVLRTGVATRPLASRNAEFPFLQFHFLIFKMFYSNRRFLHRNLLKKTPQRGVDQPLRLAK